MEINKGIPIGVKKDDIAELLYLNLPVGIILVNSEGYLLSANDYMFKYFNTDNHNVEDIGFGNLFNCEYSVHNNIVCGEGEKCNYCNIRKTITSVISDKTNVHEEEVKHKIFLNGRESTMWFSLQGCPISQDGEDLALITFSDISLRKKTELELVRLGITDELTGLYNRRFILDQLRKVLMEKRSSKKPISLAMIDIDRFKDINDIYGHIFGDRVLKGLGHILKQHTREGDFAGRYGGEEFLFLIDNIGIDLSTKTISRVAVDIKNMFKDVVDKPLTFSCGLIEIYPDDEEDYAVVDYIDRVDKLLYKAKENGKNRIEI